MPSSSLLPVHLESIIPVVAYLSNRGQILETIYEAFESSGGLYWPRSNMRPYENGMSVYVAFHDFYDRLVEVCHHLDDVTFLQLGLDLRDFRCHDVEIYLILDDSVSSTIEVTEQNWEWIATTMRQRLRDRSPRSIQGVRFYVKWTHSLDDGLIAHQIRLADEALQTGGAVASSPNLATQDSEFDEMPRNGGVVASPTETASQATTRNEAPQSSSSELPTPETQMANRSNCSCFGRRTMDADCLHYGHL